MAGKLISMDDSPKKEKDNSMSDDVKKIIEDYVDSIYAHSYMCGFTEEQRKEKEKEKEKNKDFGEK